MERSSGCDEFVPAYVGLLERGELSERADAALRHLENCDLCARYCRVDRLRTLEGAVCRTGEKARVASYGAHHGEEDCLRGDRGSGTIFFGWCNLRCVFCQNWDISQKGSGKETGTHALADRMLELQAQGCHNINFVSPSHVVAQIIAAVDDAARRGLRLPLVYNTGGYDSLEAHLVLPGNLAGTEGVLAFLANEVSRNTYINIMDQYHPCYRAEETPPLRRSLRPEEFRDALGIAESLGLSRLDHRAARVRRW